jgi:hypothetical protein
MSVRIEDNRIRNKNSYFTFRRTEKKTSLIPLYLFPSSINNNNNNHHNHNFRSFLRNLDFIKSNGNEKEEAVNPAINAAPNCVFNAFSSCVICFAMNSRAYYIIKYNIVYNK